MAEYEQRHLHPGDRVKPPVLQKTLPNPPWIDPVRWHLPGVQPLETADWVLRDDAFAEQMALRDEHIASRRDEVHALLPNAVPAAEECFETVLAALRTDPGYQFGEDAVTRPDGVTVPLDRTAPLLTSGRLVQADLCLMETGPTGHCLTGAILCFPAHWTLAEKLGRPLTAIHGPVPEYDANLAKRVQRLFDAMRPGRLLWRSNAILYEAPDLFTPKAEEMADNSATLETARFVRSERQVLRKLPKTGAIVFSIHTYMVAIDALSKDARDALPLILR